MVKWCYYANGFQFVTHGTYTVTVTDANGCTRTATAGLTTFPAPSCSVNVVQTSTLGNNGVLTVNVTSGTAPYNFLWSNGANTLEQSLI
ncbi:MAG: hypothetical protein R2795_19365 [Saprospiraceae bacterium]